MSILSFPPFLPVSVTHLWFTIPVGITFDEENNTFYNASLLLIRRTYHFPPKNKVSELNIYDNECAVVRKVRHKRSDKEHLLPETTINQTTTFSCSFPGAIVWQ